MGLSIKLKIIIIILFLVLSSNLIMSSYIAHLMKEGIIQPDKIGDLLYEKEVLVVMISTFILVLIICILFSVTLIEPVDKLIIGTQLVAEGKLDYQIKKQSSDEIGRLVDAFNEMIRKLRTSIEKETQSLQKALLEKTKAELIVNSMADGVLVTDNEQNIILFNQAAENIFNIDASSVLKKHMLHLNKFGFSKLFYDIIEEKLKERGKKNNIITQEFEIKTPEKKTIATTISPLKDESGKTAGTVILIQDITKIKEIEEMKNGFISIVSHELRTPLTSILGYTTLFANKKLGPLTPKQERAIDVMNKESNTLHVLINDLLDLSKLETGKVKLKNTPTVLVECIENSPALHLIQKKKITLKIGKPKKKLIMNIDKGKITQVFTNLLSNAAKFTPENGKIDIRIQKRKSSIKVNIRDTGIGIAKKHIPQLFNKFYQVESHLRRNIGGTGLGLSIVKEIIDLYSGSITVTSKLKKGTTISFTLPYEEQEGTLQKEVDKKSKGVKEK